MSDSIFAYITFGINQADVDGIMKAIKKEDDLHGQYIEINFCATNSASVHCSIGKDPHGWSASGSNYSLQKIEGVWTVLDESIYFS